MAPETDGAAQGPAYQSEDLQQAKAAFLAQHGDSYGYQGWIDRNWQQEVGVRMPGQHYLDHTGAGQYANSQVAAALKELQGSAFGNPHSRNPSSARATHEVAAARQAILDHFSADPNEYMVVFTKGASEGLKMVGEYFPWTQPKPGSSSNNSGGGRSSFIYTQANHKSVLGIAAYGRRSGAELHCITREGMDAWLGSPAGTSIAAAAALASRGGSSDGSKHGRTQGKSGGGRAISVEARSGAAAAGQAVAAGSPSAAAQPEPAPQQQQSRADAAGANAVPPAAAAPLAPAKIDLQRWRAPRESEASGALLHLVAFPAKDNYEGQLYPVEWVDQVHARSDRANRFYVLLDIAAFAATHSLDLSRVKPDFLTMSFYKLFGFPSGLGALLVRHEAAMQLCRGKTYFGGGSVDYCTAEDAWHILSEPPAGLEDGTLGFLSIAALKHGFNLFSNLGGMKAITAHTESLRLWTYQQLSQLRHSNGRPMLKLFGRHAEGPSVQCSIFQFQVLTPGGDRVPGGLVEAAATAAGLHIRTGCACNPGRCLANLGITPEEERARAAQRHKGPVLIVMRPRGPSSPGDGAAVACGAGPEPAAADGSYESRQAQSAVPVPLPLGSVRASLGALSTFEDCHALVRFLHTFRDFEIYERDISAGVKLLRVLDDEQHATEVTATIITRESAGGAAGGGKAADLADVAAAAAATAGVADAGSDGWSGGIRDAIRSFWIKWGDLSENQEELWLAGHRAE